MIYNYKDIKKIYKNNYSINKAINNKKLFKLETNVYSDKELVDPIIVYSKRYPYGIITMDTAFYYYNLTDSIPDKIYIATPSNSRIIKNKQITQIFMDKKILNYGRAIVELDGEKVFMYNKERLLVELIRKKNQIPFDYYKEIISNYRKIIDNLDMSKIEQYVSLFKSELSLFETLQREVF